MAQINGFHAAWVVGCLIIAGCTIRVAAYPMASVPEAPIQAITPVSATHTVDCSPGPWPPNVAPNTLQLALATRREAVAGDPVAQWVLGSLYLHGLAVPKDFTAGTKWIKSAADTAAPEVGLSEAELFAIMLDGAEALPDLVERDGAAWGIAQYKQGARTIIQALSCPYNPSLRR
jgi:hypothetical protein